MPLVPSTSDPDLIPRKISIVLPTWQGEADLRELLPALKRQAGDFHYEICAIDSGSTDRTVELLEEVGACIQVIDQKDFRHGATRNRCADESHGEFFVFLSQDVVPTDEHFLEKLVKPFSDPRVAGTYGRVLPRPDDDPLTARTVLELPEAEEEPWVRDLDGKGPVWDMEPEERGAYLRFNNVASAVRASVFREIPFPELGFEIGFGEDFAWAARTLTAGWRIAYVPDAVVYHAHRYSMRKVYERYRVDAVFHRMVHGWQLRPSWVSALRGFLYEVRQDTRFLLRPGVRNRLRALLRSPGLRAAQVLGQYVGSR